MTESDNEDEKRRERARRVGALTDAARQPGEGPRIGTRIAGSVAVLALVAGGALGIGAWHSYQAESAEKEAKAAKLERMKEAAARKDASPSPSPTASKKRTRQEQPRTSPQKKETEKPEVTVHKRQPKVKLTPGAKTANEGFSRIALANKSTEMCADLPGIDGHPEGDGPIGQYPCDASDNDNQVWNVSVSHAGAGPDSTDLVMIANVKDNLCFDLPGFGGKPVDTHVQEHACNGSMQDNQQWRFEAMPDGSNRIHNYASNGLCLKVADDALDRVNTPLVLGDCQAPSAEWFLRR